MPKIKRGVAFNITANATDFAFLGFCAASLMIALPFGYLYDRAVSGMVNPKLIGKPVKVKRSHCLQLRQARQLVENSDIQ